MEDGIESEKIPDNFICAVCLDVLYKPVVLVCGHVSCFWCCQRSMHMEGVSHCPLCRNPYHHFPAICQMLHFFLKKSYPISYDRRKKQTLEFEEKSSLGFSLDIDSLVTSKEVNHQSNVGQPSDEGSSAGTCTPVSAADLACGVCKQLLFRPVVFNCGHVYCVVCVTVPEDGVIECQVCQSRHPSGVPKVCKELDHFLEEQFPLIHAQRKSSTQLLQDGIQNANLPVEANCQGSKISYPTDENFLQWWTIHGSKFHQLVGCDMCGMCPIIGDRYRCKDCTEKSGYDLCGDCYNSGTKLPGRFNQKHTPEHQLELMEPTIRLLRGQHAILSAAAAVRPQSSPANGTQEFASLSLDDDDDDDDDSVGGHVGVVTITSPIVNTEDQSDTESSM